MVNEGRSFSARWSVGVWVSTILIGLLVFVFIPYQMINAARTEAVTQALKGRLFLLGLIPSLFILTLFFAPINYTITNSEVVVNRLGPNVVIPIETIEEITRIEKRRLPLLRTLRLGGVGGFCGAYGLFWNRRLGLFRGYITNRETLVFIRCKDGRKILLSPNRPEAFLEAVSEGLKQ